MPLDEKIIQKMPEYAARAYQRALESPCMETWQEAADLHEIVNELYLHDANFQWKEGLARFQLCGYLPPKESEEQLMEALQSLSVAYEHIDKENKWAVLYDRARAFLTKGEINCAILDLEEARECAKTDEAQAQVLLGLGTARIETREYEEAQLMFKNSLSKNPTAEAYHQLCNIFMLKQEWDGIIEYTTAGIKRFQDPKLYKQRAQAYLEKAERTTQNRDGLLQKALNNFRKVCDIRPNDGHAMYDLAYAQHLLGIRAAQHNLERAKELDPTVPDKF